MHVMTPDERRAFMMAGTRTGKLAVTRRDGGPHVAPVWFVLDGDVVVFMTGATTTKGHAIRRTGRAALAVDDERPPFSFVTLEGRAAISRAVDEVLPWSIRIAERYMGAERAEEYGKRNAVPGELLVRLTPDRLTAVADIAD